MARLSCSVCLLLVAAAVLLLVAPAAAGRRRSYYEGLGTENCYHTVKQCLRRACKCGWELNDIATNCLYFSNADSGSDTRDTRSDPGCSKRLSTSQQYLDLNGMCEVGKSVHLGAMRRLGMDVESYTYNMDDCKDYVGGLCGLQQLIAGGSNVLLFSRASQYSGFDRPRCGSCLSMAKTVAKEFCDYPKCPCKGSPFDFSGGAASRGRRPSRENYNCYCIVPPSNPCDGEVKTVAASTDAAATGK